MFTRILLESIAAPWCAPAYLAARIGAPADDVEAVCRRLVARGLMQRAAQRLAHLPDTVVAPTADGLARAADDAGVTSETLAAWAQLTPERFWLLRADLETTQQAYALGVALRRALPGAEVRDQVMAVRAFRKQAVVLHSRLAVRAADDGWRAFHMLIDAGAYPPTAWARTLRYYAAWSRRGGRREAAFPPLLIVTADATRARALLLLARDLGARMAVHATWDRTTVYGPGPHVARWVGLADEGDLVPASPFTQGERFPPGSAFVPPSVASLASTRAREPHPFAWAARPAWSDGLERVESLDATHLRLLEFICHHPACPASTVEAFFGETAGARLASALERLAELRLVERVAFEGRGREGLVATATAVRLIALRHGRSPDVEIEALSISPQTEPAKIRPD